MSETRRCGCEADVSAAVHDVGDSRRPFPQDIEMRRGLLGQLTSGAKPHSQAGTGGGGDMLPPPEKKFALAGMVMLHCRCELLCSE